MIAPEMYIHVYRHLYALAYSGDMHTAPVPLARRAWTALVPDHVFDFWAERVSPTWSRRRSLARIVAREVAADDTVTLVLSANRHVRLPAPGQHLMIGAEVDGRRVSRSYSPTPLPGHRFSITVKAVPEGRLSRHLVRSARAPGRPAPIRSRTDSMAVASDSVDAVLLPHTLEYEPEPHEILREVERILTGEGHLIIFGFRPLSSWGVRHLFARDGFPPGLERFIGERRLRDWLKLLGFEIVDARRYLFTLPWGAAGPSSHSFFERAGALVWPLFAGGYVLKARKRVYTLTPIRPRWRLRPKVVGGLIEPTTRM
jgi:hypothetical protein